MNRPTRPLLIFGCILFLAAGLLGQEKPAAPDAQSILKKTREVYRDLDSYHFVHALTIESKKAGEKEQKTTARIQMEAASEKAERQGPPLLPLNSDRCRLEAKGSKEGILMVIGNGSATLYTHGKQEYMKGSSLHSISTSVGGSLMLGIFLGPFEILNEHGIDQVKVVRSEKLLLAKQEHTCYVIEGILKPGEEPQPGRLPEKIVLGIDWQLTMMGAFLSSEQAGMYMPTDDTKKPNTFTLWIDQKTHLMLKSQIRATLQFSAKNSSADEPIHIVATDTFSQATINTALPKELFEFKAQEGAKQIPNVREGKPK